MEPEQTNVSELLEKFKVSSNESSLIACFWFLEVLLKAIISMNGESIPDDKKALYTAFSEHFMKVYGEVCVINDHLDKQVQATLGIEFATDLAESINSIGKLFETTKPKKIRAILDQLGKML